MTKLSCKTTRSRLPRLSAILADAKSRTYGANNPTFTGTVGGFQTGDTQANATTGSLTFTSPATSASNVGSYAINGGGLSAINDKYTFLQAAGNATALTVTPATLLYTANAASQQVGNANTIFSGTVTGFVLGQTLGTVTVGTPAFSSTTTASSAAGQYAITGSGLALTGAVLAITSSLRRPAMRPRSRLHRLRPRPGRYFPASFTVFRVNGRGGNDIPFQLENHIGDRSGFLCPALERDL